MAEYAGRELPRLTPAMAKRMQAARRGDGERAWRAQWDFLAEVLGAEALSGEVGAQTLAEADVPALGATFARVCAAYDAPRVEAQREQVAQALGALDVEGAANVQRLAEVVRTLSELDRRQGFRFVD